MIRVAMRRPRPVLVNVAFRLRVGGPREKSFSRLTRCAVLHLPRAQKEELINDP